METFQFKTNINCECCYKEVIPYMEDIKGVRYWNVAIDDPDKILQVEGVQSEQEIINAIMKAGYKIEKIG